MQIYYIIRNGEQSGPHPMDEITAMLAAGELSQDDLCWAEGMPEWQPVRRVLSPAPAPGTPPSPTLLPDAPKPGNSSLLEAMKNLGGSLIAIGKSLIEATKAALGSKAAQETKQLVAEKSSMIRKKATELARTAANSEAVRTAADKINKGAADIRKKAADLAHHEESSLPPPPPVDAISATPEPTGTSQESFPASTEYIGRRINWIPALIFICITAAIWCLSNLATLEDGNPEDGLMYILAGLPIAILGVIFLSLLHFKCWMTLPAEFRATTPGKAVGFMFIPFYNFYWAFISWPKLSDGLSNWQKSTGANPTNTKGLGITFAILFVCHSTLGLVPALGILIRIAMVVIFILYYLKVVRGLNRMLGNSAASPSADPAKFWTFKRTATSLAVALPLYWVILAITYDPPRRGGYSSGERLPSWYTAVQGMSGGEYSRNQRCSSCNGTGVSRFQKSVCMRCNGGGTVTTGSGYAMACPSCRGEGRVSTCQSCAGTGYTR